MKIHIVNNITNEPHGGGNQFLRALRKKFIEKNAHTHNPSLADVYLFNSHQNVEEVMSYKRQYPQKRFVHRVDGPMRLYNKLSDTRDDIVYFLNDQLADGTIFQSAWSQERNFEMGLKKTKPYTVINNAVNDEIFNQANKRKASEKIRLISTSFSKNIRKGFSDYKFLDENLDFTKYEYSFLGNSPYSFNNIKLKGCLQTSEVALQLKQHDIFITASENDPCSNSLIEALACGLPAIALNSGGHPEILCSGGILYKKTEELIEKIKEMSRQINDYRENIKIKNLDEISNEYISFLKIMNGANHT
jgi:glycosyltransferase involved in cell wall biosynthesis